MFQRFLTYIFGIMVFAIAGLFIAPNFLDLNKFKNSFASSVKDITGVLPVIEGDAKVAFLPYPKLTLGSMSIPNIPGAQSDSIFSADGVEVNFTFASLTKGVIEPSSITLLRPHLEIEKMPNGEQNWLNLLRNKSKAVHNTPTIPSKIVIANGTITYRSGTNRTAIDYISSNIFVESPHGPFNFKGSISQESAIVNFSGKIGDLSKNSDSVVNITSESFDLSLKGKYTSGDVAQMAGAMDFNIKNLNYFTDSFFSDLPILKKIKSDESMEIKSDLIISKEITSFKKLTIASDSIKGSGNIDALYNRGTTDNIEWDVSLDLSKINNDSLKNGDKKSDAAIEGIASNIATTSTLNSYNFDIPQDISAILKLSVAELTYNGQKAHNISIDTELFDGRALVHNISAQLPGNSRIEFSGNADNNGIRPIFTGKIKAYGDELRSSLLWLYPEYSYIPEDQLQQFLFSCDVNATPRIIDISNIYGSVDRTLLNGSILLHPADTVPSINGEIKIDRLNFDSYNATGKINDAVTNFITKGQDSNLDSSWLKNYNYKLALSISADDMVYNNNNIKNVSASVAAAKGLLSIQNLNIDSNLVNLKGKIGINLLKPIPEIAIDISSPNFDTAALFLQEEDKKQAASPASIWSREPINLMGLHRFSGRLNFAVRNFKNNNLVLNNLSLKGDLKNSIFTCNECKSDFGTNGKLSIKGSMGISPEAPSLGISILASAVEIQDITRALKSKNTTIGTIYLGGVIKTFGLTPYDWANNLNATAKLSTRNAIINGIDLETIIDQSSKLFSVIDMNEVVAQATLSGTTHFMSIDGNLAADKGILQAKDFALATEKSRGAFAGNISLHNFQVKGLGKIDYLPERTKKVSLGISVDGTLPDSITYKLDKSNLEQYITGRAIK